MGFIYALLTVKSWMGAKNRKKLAKRTTEKAKPPESCNVEVQDMSVQTDPINLTSISDRDQVRQEVRTAVKQMYLEYSDDDDYDIDSEFDYD